MLNLDDGERGSPHGAVSVPETHPLTELLEELSGTRLRTVESPLPQGAQVPPLNYPLCDKDEGEEEPPGLW